MKKIALSLAISVLSLGAFAQQVNRFVLGSAGKEMGTSALSMECTFGELAVSSFTATSTGLPQVTYQLTQGFHQGISTRQLARMATGEWVEMDDKNLEQQSQADLLAGFTMNLYPNPTIGTVHLDFSGKLEGNTHFSLTDGKGQQVLSGEISDMRAQLDLSQTEPGVYILQIMNPTSNMHRTFKIVKQ
jgi:hypothetical protein